MKRLNRALVLTLMSWGIMANNASAQITIDAVPVGNAGNANDPTTGFGAVDYDYSIGTYEVTLNQYTAFLNAVGAADTYGLYRTAMGSDPRIMGITRSGAPGNYTYSVLGSGARPVTYVTWYSAARFVNWLHNGQPVGAQAADTTETGAYTLNGALNGIINRNASWNYGLPSQNEWYKAAYHQPASAGGDADGYWLYPTASNLIPNSRNGSASDANSANFYRNVAYVDGVNGGYAVAGSTSFPTGNALTDACSFSLARSYYGTFDQGGNVWELTDAVIGGNHVVRGGSWSDTEVNLRASDLTWDLMPVLGWDNVGFRVVMIPEPSVIGFMALGVAMLAGKRKRTLTHAAQRTSGLDRRIADGTY